jgi:putative DNA primase/helicase
VVIGRKLGIRPQAHTDWTEYANQWALLIGRPGVLKSPAMEQALGPIRQLAAQAIEAHKDEMRRYTANLKVAKENDEEPPEKPILKRYVANDTTAAALGELHRQNPNGVLVHRDEAVSLLRSLDREENSEARGFYLTGWNGNSPYTFDRIIRGLNLHIPAVCLSLLGSSQPGRIGSYLRAACIGGAGDDGLIQRFGLLVWPDTPGDWHDVDRWPNVEAKRAAFELFDYLDKASGFDLGGQQGQYEETPFLRFDDGGLELFQHWRRGLGARLRSEQLHPALESHLAKYRKLVTGC